MKTKQRSIVPLCTALKKSLKAGYSRTTFKHDFIAGLIVSFVALPLAMALSIAVGLPPQHGLYTAIVAGFVVPLLGGSRLQVSGPTAAFVVIIAPIVAQHGLRGIVITTMMAGVILITLGIIRVGRLIESVPHSVITGFTSGIAVVIGTLALNDLLGLGIHTLPDSYIQKVLLIVQNIPTLYGPDCIIGLLSLAIMSGTQRFFPELPAPLIGIGIGTLGATLFQACGCAISTIGSNFSYTLSNGTVGGGIPPLLPMLLDAVRSFVWPKTHELTTFFVPACTVAALGALESLLSAAVADRMTRTKHDPDAELVGIGIGNILSGFASGIPATGAIARTATNVHNGGKTPISSSLHALFILLYALVLMPVLSRVPMASLAALLVRVACQMSHYEEFKQTLQTGPKQEAIVLVVCFLLTIFVDMLVGVSVGLLLAWLLSRRT